MSPPFLQSKSLATARLPRTQYEHQHQHHRQRLSDCLHSLHVLLSTQNSDITYFSSLATFTKVIVTAAMDLQSPEFGFFQPLEVRLMICKSRQSPNWSRSFLNFKIDSSASRGLCHVESNSEAMSSSIPHFDIHTKGDDIGTA